MTENLLSKLQRLQGATVSSVYLEIFSIGGKVDLRSSLPVIGFTCGSFIMVTTSHTDERIEFCDFDLADVRNLVSSDAWDAWEADVGAWFLIKPISHPIVNALIGRKLDKYRTIEENSEIVGLELFFGDMSVEMKIGENGLETTFRAMRD